MRYKVFYKEDNAHEIELDEQQIKIDGKATDIDLVKLLDNKFHILQNHKSYNIEVLHTDYNLKRFSIKVNNNIYDLNLQTELDILLEKMGMSAAGDEKMDNVKAPMPGLVLDVLVEIGQAVKKGDNLLILEAMKMENIIKASGNGIVKSIKINKKDAVEKGQLLIEME
ncbi:MAG TPA: acetyl-CoA carboxylase biotin carboxyl carrier protein subunit [Chitinophagales bacterium]|nr:acetyl-CoA carboxylase biotin carboxyl carrier protein subunit [Chitinophagales bacterium]HMW12153.1 acetyl-CoA carboxylase biotin carboxyl carrier protein subunit [Chitinophagales bacterium]HMX61271.1 acetyl-CoA carboxylase biotin carboxyl carrier protein subunit [Chitinophagales bacterium]HMY23553.1 acetyl-CoA carboxylase biotin carboxyl carrier protein subunit [Chitinophagales bacterium]HMZ33565.1 acetyl-CoA carboxylase biotin carboxyl carrier protein subunit [Chitinophagales bacterium]